MAPLQARGGAVAKQSSKAKRAKPRRRINTGLTALVAVIFLLVAGAAATVYWLESSYDPTVDPYGRIELSDTSTTPPESQNAGASDGDGESTTDAVQDGHGKDDDGQKAAMQTDRGPAGGDHGSSGSDADSSDTGSNDADGESSRQQAAAGHGDTDNEQNDTTQPGRGTPAEQETPYSEPVAEVARLTPAPQPDLVKQSPTGPLPVISPEGRTPLAVYARPYEPSGRPRIAVVLTELGMAEAKTIAAIQQLPGPVTLAFHPYGRNLQDYVDQARAAGHEVMLEIPMEPLRLETNDPGNYALLTSLPTRTNLEHLDWLLGRFSGYVGVVNFMGDRFTTSEPHLRPVLEAMRGRGLMFLDRRTSPRSVAADIAAEIGLPGIGSDREIDSQASRAAIGTQLRELERLARTNGQAVGMAYPYPVTIELLSEWARGLRAKGIDLVPASALVRVTG